MDKVERLLTLTATLLTANRPLSADELRERISGYPEGTAAFRRAFERDKDDLREMGIPLLVDEVPGVDPPVQGYRIDRADYYLRDPGFSPDELAALRLAASLVQLDAGRGLEGLWKLGGADAEPDAADQTLAELPADPHLPPLFEALSRRARVSFTYAERDRQVDPYRLEFQRGRWYLTGFDHSRGERRSFRVDRITSDVRVGTAGTFTSPDHPSAGTLSEPWRFGEGEPAVAHVLVDPDQAGWAVQQLGEGAVVEERADGSVVVQLQVTNPAAFRSFVLTFLDHAEVLAPPSLRDDLVAWLEAQVEGVPV